MSSNKKSKFVATIPVSGTVPLTRTHVDGLIISLLISCFYPSAGRPVVAWTKRVNQISKDAYNAWQNSLSNDNFEDYVQKMPDDLAAKFVYRWSFTDMRKMYTVQRRLQDGYIHPLSKLEREYFLAVLADKELCEWVNKVNADSKAVTDATEAEVNERKVAELTRQLKDLGYSVVKKGAAAENIPTPVPDTTALAKQPKKAAKKNSKKKNK